MRPKGRIKLGSLLAEIGQDIELSEEESAIFDGVRDKASAQAANFE